jgi:curved DNA-binding protein CbpA
MHSIISRKSIVAVQALSQPRLSCYFSRHDLSLQPILLNHRREYATSSDFPKWPTSTHPSPYDIFNTTKETFDAKVVRNHFYTLAKIYHPDSLVKLDNLTSELKADRFKKIVAAYDILKDDKKRREYDLFKTGWQFGDEAVKKRNFTGRDFSRAARYKPYRPGATNSEPKTSWDDYHQDYREYQKQQDPEYQKQAWEQHKKMVCLVALGSFVVGAIQFKFLMNSARKDIEGRNKLSSKAQERVYLASINYGMGDHKEARIKRFLAHRDGTTSYNNYKELMLSQESKKLALDSQSTLALSSPAFSMSGGNH